MRALPNTVPFFVNGYMKLCQGNRYVATLHAINNCLVKLSKITPAKKLYRGMTNLRLPEPFYKPDPPFKLAGQAQGGGDGGDDEGGYGSLTMGGVEFGFMSATGDRSVAVRYSSGTNVQGLILEIDQGMLDRGASLQWLSQYPHEAETCFPPCTGLELKRRADGSTAKRVAGCVTIVELRAQPARLDGSRRAAQPSGEGGSDATLVRFGGQTGATLEEAWRKADAASKAAEAEREAARAGKQQTWGAALLAKAEVVTERRKRERLREQRAGEMVAERMRAKAEAQRIRREAEEARRRAEEEARRLAEEEAKRLAEEERRRKAEAKRRALEKARLVLLASCYVLTMCFTACLRYAPCTYYVLAVQMAKLASCHAHTMHAC